jgi:hypothetical protein
VQEDNLVLHLLNRRDSPFGVLPAPRFYQRSWFGTCFFGGVVGVRRGDWDFFIDIFDGLLEEREGGSSFFSGALYSGGLRRN